MRCPLSKVETCNGFESSPALGSQEVGDLGGEGASVLEQEAVSGVAVEQERRIVEVLDRDVGGDCGDHHVVHAVGVENGLLDRLEAGPHGVEGLARICATAVSCPIAAVSET
jgi:hypothetical protein